jgi:heat shock protein HslJ
MKRYIFPFALIAILCAASSCKHLPIDPDDDFKDTIDYRPHLLKGTSWQLFGHLDNRSMAVAPTPVNEKIILTFGTETEAWGGTSFNKYTVNWKADNANIAFENLVSTKVAVPEFAYEGEYFRILNGARTYLLKDNGKTLIISDGMESLYFHPENPNGNPSDFKGVVHLADFRLVKFQVDEFQIQAIKKIDDTHLAITVQYGGGCEEHDFNLFADEIYQSRGGADYVEMMITHNSHNDLCEALITKELIFDMSPLLKKWESTSVNNRLVLNISQGLYLSNVIEYSK